MVRDGTGVDPAGGAKLQADVDDQVEDRLGGHRNVRLLSAGHHHEPDFALPYAALQDAIQRPSDSPFFRDVPAALAVVTSRSGR